LQDSLPTCRSEDGRVRKLGLRSRNPRAAQPARLAVAIWLAPFAQIKPLPVISTF